MSRVGVTLDPDEYEEIAGLFVEKVGAEIDRHTKLLVEQYTQHDKPWTLAIAANHERWEYTRSVLIGIIESVIDGD